MDIIEELISSGDCRNYQYFDCLLNNRTIILNEDISDSIVEKVALPLIKFEKDASEDPVELYINTAGGSVFDGMFLCDIIDKYKKKLNVHITGTAFSMGFYIACAGKDNPNVHKDCTAFSYGLLHAGSVGIQGDARKVKQIQAFYDKLDTKTRDYILSHTTITEEEYENNLDVEWYMTAEDMLKFGVVDEIRQ